MVLYHPITIYHLLECICIQINENINEKSVCLLPDFIIYKFPQYSLLEKKNIFDKVVLYPYTKDGNRDISDFDKIHFKEHNDYILKLLTTYELCDFDRIYCFVLPFTFNVYAIKNSSTIIAIEDAIGAFSYRRESLNNEFCRQDLGRFEIGKRIGLLNYESSAIKQIYADVPDDYSIDDNRVKRYRVIDELKKIEVDKLKDLREIFGAKNIDKEDWSKSLMFLTQHPANLGYLSMDEQIEMETLTVDYFSTLPNLILKPHPDDVLYYNDIFSDALILPNAFPIELLSDFVESSDTHVMTITSSSINNFKAEDKIDFYDEYLCGKYSIIHKCYAVKMLYDYLCSEFCCQFVMKNDDENKKIFKNWKIDINHEYLDDEECGTEIVKFLFVTDNISECEVRNYLSSSNRIVIFTTISDNMLRYIKNEGLDKFQVRDISIYHTDSEKIDMQHVYILSNNMKIMDILKEFSYEKILKYSNEVVKLESMNDYEIEIAQLKGILEATERRLLAVLEENKELKKNGEFYDEK